MGMRYRIEEQIGIGRAGAVYKALDTQLNRHVALRRFNTDLLNCSDDLWLNEFRDIVSDLSRINHPNVLSIFDADVDEIGPYLVTAHVEGDRLSLLLKKDGGMTIKEIYSFTRQCLNALQAAEGLGYYHHALSPSSVIASPRPSGGYHYTLMDLGHSKLLPLAACDDSLALSKTLDPALMAPEVYEGNPSGIRSTLYMFGQLIYWLIVGGHPFAGLSLDLAHAKHKAGEIPYIRAYRSDVSEAFRRWIYWLIEPDVALRPESVMKAIKKLPSFEDAIAEAKLPQPMRIDAQGVIPSYATKSAKSMKPE